MTLRTLVLTALLAVLFVHADARHPEPVALTDIAAQGSVENAREADDRCSTGRTGYYWAIGDWFTGNEVYAALGRPETCADCGGGWMAASVTMFLYWPSAEQCELTAVGGIREAIPCGESYMPGPLIVASEPTPVGGYEKAGLWAVTLDMPDNVPILTGPFFATVEFLDACGNLPKVVTDSGPCVVGQSWNDWGSGWQGLCDFSFPGDLSLYATLQCQGPTPVERNTWTTIKAIYRNP